MRIALVEPQIPPNTGNIARLCAATRIPLHLIRPLGFEITDRHLRRAGLDYWDLVELQIHDSWEEFVKVFSGRRLRFFSKKAPRSYLEAGFSSQDCLVFGSETTGLSDQLLAQYSQQLYTIPILEPRVRSLNLASAVAVAAYDALRQTGQLAAR